MVSAYTMAEFTPQSLTEHELRSLGAGFIIEISSARQWTDFEAFRAALSLGRIEDWQWGGQRQLGYSRGDVRLDLIYDYRFLSLRRASSDSAPAGAKAISKTLELAPSLA